MMNLRPIRHGLAAALLASALVLAACDSAKAATRVSPWPILNEKPAIGTNIVAFGDSLTYLPHEVGVKTYPEFLSASLGKPIINAGGPGDTTSTAALRLERDVLNKNPRVVIVLLGGNDYMGLGLSIETIATNLRAIIDKIQAKGAMVVLVGIEVPFAQQPTATPVFEKLARDKGCVFVPDVMKDIMNNPKMMHDAVHPNDKGAELIAQRIHEFAGDYLTR